MGIIITIGFCCVTLLLSYIADEVALIRKHIQRSDR